mmetsp:Transcript_8817/g.10091  ORF Transcript_8817/g.10091 Transcript_8817/m.10091 type:complete len:121 (-) Transcript_8817:3756-4118(-)
MTNSYASETVPDYLTGDIYDENSESVYEDAKSRSDTWDTEGSNETRESSGSLSSGSYFEGIIRSGSKLRKNVAERRKSLKLRRLSVSSVSKGMHLPTRAWRSKKDQSFQDCLSERLYEEN